MALKKVIIQENGIPLEYHRIYSIENILNKNTKIIIYSYLNESEREKELELEEEGSLVQSLIIYKVASTENLKYDDELTAKNAYNYLKLTEKYKDAEDI